MPLPTLVLVAMTLIGATPPTKVVVLPTQFFDAGDAAPPAEVFDEALLTAIGQAGSFLVIGRDDLQTILGLEKQKELLGCDELSCMAELAGALDADQLVAVKVARTDEQWIVTAKLIHLRGTPEAKNRLTEFVGGTATELLRAPSAFVPRLFGAAPAAPLAPAVHRPAHERRFTVNVGLGAGFQDDGIPEAGGLSLYGGLAFRGQLEPLLGWQLLGAGLILPDFGRNTYHLDLFGAATVRLGPVGDLWYLGLGPWAGPFFVLYSDDPGDRFAFLVGGLLETGFLLGEEKRFEVGLKVRAGSTVEFAGGMFVNAWVTAGYGF